MYVNTFGSFNIISSSPSLLFADGMKAKRLYLDLCNATTAYHKWISIRNASQFPMRAHAMARADEQAHVVLKAQEVFSNFCREKGIIRVEPNLSRG